jgi:hypothetical protein
LKQLYLPHEFLNPSGSSVDASRFYEERLHSPNMNGVAKQLLSTGNINSSMRSIKPNDPVNSVREILTLYWLKKGI